MRPTAEKGDTSSRQFSVNACLGQCAVTVGMKHHVCETEMCSENVVLPLVFTEGMFCVRGGQAVVDRTVTITECQVVPYILTDGRLTWLLVISKGILCKAICYNIVSLLGNVPLFASKFYVL